jgi:hypothetical protein
MTELTLPPFNSAADELITVETDYGPMPKWKARALAIGWFQAMTRADDAQLALDPAEEPPDHDDADADGEDERVERERLMDQLLGKIGAKLDQLERRLDEMVEQQRAQHRAQRAQRALTDLEDKIEAGVDPLAITDRRLN